MLFTTTITMPTFTKTEMQDFENYPIMPPDQFISSAEKMPFLIPKVDTAIWEMIGEYKEEMEKQEWFDTMPDIYDEYINELNTDGTHGIINWETISKDKEMFTERMCDAMVERWGANRPMTKWECVGKKGADAKHLLRIACRNGVFPKRCLTMSAITFLNLFMKYKDPSAEKIDYFDTAFCPFLFESFVKDRFRSAHGIPNHRMRTFVHYKNWSDADCQKWHTSTTPWQIDLWKTKMRLQKDKNRKLFAR